MNRTLLLALIFSLSLVANNREYLDALPRRISIIKMDVAMKVADVIRENRLEGSKEVLQELAQSYKKMSIEILKQAKCALKEFELSADKRKKLIEEDDEYFSDLNIEMDFVLGAICAYKRATTVSAYDESEYEETTWRLLSKEIDKAGTNDNSNGEANYISNMFKLV